MTKHRTITGFVAVALLAAATAASAPKPVSIAELSSEWQCSKTAFVLTTCTPVRPFNGTAQNPTSLYGSKDDQDRAIADFDRPSGCNPDRPPAHRLSGVERK
jgi:hypothetical protein